MRMAKEVTKVLRAAFRATDAAGVEAIALLYGAREGGNVAFTMSDFLVVKHGSATFSCSTLPAQCCATTARGTRGRDRAVPERVG